MLSKPTHRRPGLELLAPPLCGLLISLAVLFPAAGSETTTPPQAEPAFLGRHLADYNSELRRPDGRVDTDALLTRLKELHVTAYYWLIWHAATDWDDLKLFLPKAR